MLLLLFDSSWKHSSVRFYVFLGVSRITCARHVKHWNENNLNSLRATLFLIYFYYCICGRIKSFIHHHICTWFLDLESRRIQTLTLIHHKILVVSFKTEATSQMWWQNRAKSFIIRITSRFLISRIFLAWSGEKISKKQITLKIRMQWMFKMKTIYWNIEFLFFANYYIFCFWFLQSRRIYFRLTVGIRRIFNSIMFWRETSRFGSIQ